MDGSLKPVHMNNHDVLIVDYGVGNHESVANALRRLGYSFTVSDKPEAIAAARAYILPGVGAFVEAMHNFEARGLIEPLRREVVHGKKPLLGICLGMQVLAEDSTEGGMHKGLGFIPGHVEKIDGSSGVRVPHVGWNGVTISQKDPLFSTLDEGVQFYFDHSYHFKTEVAYTAAQCEYGGPVTAAVQHGNIFGVQFHPEKSQNNGLRLLRAFMNYTKNHAV